MTLLETIACSIWSEVEYREPTPVTLRHSPLREVTPPSRGRRRGPSTYYPKKRHLLALLELLRMGFTTSTEIAREYKALKPSTILCALHWMEDNGLIERAGRDSHAIKWRVGRPAQP